jgi:hypothetical protein
VVPNIFLKQVPAMRRRDCTTAFVLLIAIASQAAAENSWLPSWLGGGKKPPVARQRHTPPPRTSSAHAGNKDTGWFSGLSNPFKGKQTTQPVAKRPNDPAAIRRAHEREQTSWFGSWFKPKETPPPQSINEWMELEQIKP